MVDYALSRWPVHVECSGSVDMSPHVHLLEVMLVQG